MIFMCFCCFTGDNMPSDGSSGNTGMIVGIVIGVLLGVIAAVVAVVAVVFIKKRREGKHSNLANIILPASSAATCRQHTFYRESENIERY